MFSFSVRIAAITVLIGLGIWMLWMQNYVLAAFALMLILYMIWSYFKHGTVALAAKYYRQKQFDKAEKLLNQIQNPDRLSVKRRGFYEFMLGNLALKSEQYEKAMQHFQIASNFPLQSENDKAYILLHLANLSLRNGDKNRAKIYVEKAKKFKITSKVAELIQKIESQTV